MMLFAVSAEAALEAQFSWTAVAIGVALLIANAFFVAVSIALLAARRGRIEEAAEAGDPRAQRAMRALLELPITFSGAQLGITMCSIGLGATAEPALGALFADLFGRTQLPVGAVPVLAVVVALSITVFLHMVVGEMAPKNLSIARAERVAIALAPIFRIYVTLFRPLIVLLNFLANLLVRAVGVERVTEHKLVHTAEELVFTLDESHELGTIQAQDARLMGAALRLSVIAAEQAMTPRIDLQALPDTAELTDVLALAAETGHTRIPIFHEDVDHVVGLIHVKDVLIRTDDERELLGVTDLLRPIPAVPESCDLERLLRDMLEDRSHAVLVVDEFGGTSGLITLEDVLEELVGEIADEFDDEAAAHLQGEERVWVVPGIMRRDEAQRATGLGLTESESETLSGWLVEQLGHLPQVADTVTTAEGWQLTVLSLVGYRVGDLEIRAPEAVESAR